ncbi:MAG: hypothetical protein Q4G69_08075 [Planctomycetia bacterium]|nr:hypothetical protein [Planctomycetia bacterium]
MKRIFFLCLMILAGGLLSCESFKGPLPESPGIMGEVPKNILPKGAVSFDVLLVQVPYQDRDLVRQLWNDTDEQDQDQEVRKRLHNNGFRAGIIGASVPDSLSRLLALKGRPIRTKLEEEVDLEKDDTVSNSISKPINMMEGQKSLIEVREDVVSGIPVLTMEEGSLTGKTYEDARTNISISIRNIPDGSVQFELTPMLRYGAPQMKTKYKYGQLVRTQEQPTKTFNEFKSIHHLRPGQFLVMGASEETTCGLGRYFFTNGSDDRDQKLFVIRLTITQHDEQFSRFPGFQEIYKKMDSRKENDLKESGDTP